VPKFSGPLVEVCSGVCADSCQFYGTAAELASHVEQCPYEAMSHYLRRTEGRFSELTQMLQHKDQEISFLRAMLGQLSSKVESLEKTVEGTRLCPSICLSVCLLRSVVLCSLL